MFFGDFYQKMSTKISDYSQDIYSFFKWSLHGLCTKILKVVVVLLGHQEKESSSHEAFLLPDSDCKMHFYIKGVKMWKTLHLKNSEIC